MITSDSDKPHHHSYKPPYPWPDTPGQLAEDDKDANRVQSALLGSAGSPLDGATGVRRRRGGLRAWLRSDGAAMVALFVVAWSVVGLIGLALWRLFSP